MKKWIVLIFCIALFAMPTGAMEISPPEVPQSGQNYMPDTVDSFADGLWYVFTTAIEKLMPELAESAEVCGQILLIVLISAVVDKLPGVNAQLVQLCGAVGLGIAVLKPAGSMIVLGGQTVTQMTEYGKLLIPVLTGALAAQGAVTASAALCTATSFFCTVLSSLAANLITPMLYLYFCTSFAYGALEDDLIGRVCDFLNWLITWSLKVLLYFFTGYLTLTGAVSGATDASTLKLAKLAISGMVPVVGGIMSDASEAVLVSAAVMKNAAGIYGMVAVFAVFIGPFLKIAAQYLLLKLTATLCSLIADKPMQRLTGQLAQGMGMVLAMTGCVCLFLLISIVCFMRGIGL